MLATLHSDICLWEILSNVKHMESKTLSNRQNPFICGYVGCNKSYRAKQHLVRHVKVFHCQVQNKKSIVCDQCNETFTCKQNLDKHVNRKHRQDFPFKCHFCPKGFKRKTLLAYHLYQHTGTKLLCCDFCDKKFATQTDRGRHQSKHKIFKCECAEEFANWGEIMEHKKKEHASSVYQCDICLKMFKSRAYIVRHMKIHALNDERSIFACDKCPKFYSFKYNLLHHMNSVHQNKTFDCTFTGCVAKLSTQKKLNLHIQTHLKPSVEKVKSFKPRKKRKDANIKKKCAATKLAGIPVSLKTGKNIEIGVLNCNNSQTFKKDFLFDSDALRIYESNENTPDNNCDKDRIKMEKPNSTWVGMFQHSLCNDESVEGSSVTKNENF